MASSPPEGILLAGQCGETPRRLPALDTPICRSSGPSSMDAMSSPTTSASSKTAAFFGTGGGTMRPPSTSVSSGSSSQEKEREGKEAAGSTWSNHVNRGDSWRGSQRGNRRWDTFEGKPVTPLPSPRIWEEEGKRSSNVFDIDFHGQPGASSSSRNSSRDRQSHLATFDVSISDSFSSLPSLPSLGTVQMAEPSYPEPQPLSSSSSSSKTSSFFGAARSPIPAPRLSTGVETRTEDASVPSSAFEKRQPSTTSRFYEPSRLPSAPTERGIVSGTSIASSPASTPTSNTPRVFSSLPSALEPGPDNMLPGLGSSKVPTAMISPPSPQPEDQSSDQFPATSSSSSFLSSFPSSPSTHRSQSRHVHGPSENATGSSLLPSVRAMHEARVDQGGDGIGKPAGMANADSDESEDEEVGRIGRYQIKRTLGVGAFSRVALASEVKPGKRAASVDGLVALKMIEREPCMQNERMRVSWVREVEVLKHIVHPNIVRFLTSFSTPKHHNLVLERVAGGELFDLVSDHQADLARREWLVRIFFGELASAVGWMHSINLVHRDIKLENIILTHDLFSESDLRPSSLPGRPLLKISDFGLSRFVDPASPLLETRCGSEEYAAPELIIGKRYDGRKTDVWAMGVVLYALLSGSLPFLSNGDQEGQVESQATFARGAYSRERGMAEQGALARKAHLLRIAKGDLRWPSHTNDASLDHVQPPCPTSNRLITPLARRLVARLLRRDANKRATAWEAWDEEWLTTGSIRIESSVGADAVEAPLDPRSEAGQAWLNSCARVQSGASPLTHGD